MIEGIVSGLVIATGLVSAGVGVTVAGGRIQRARRAYRRIQMLYDTLPDGWGWWFLHGFSGLTVGAHWLRASLACAGWTLAGLSLIGLGFLLF